MNEALSPDEKVFRLHIEAGPFQSGVERGKWRLIKIKWPIVIINVSAAMRENGPTEYSFRFECTNYPQSPVTAQPWNLSQDAPLEAGQWPGGTKRVPHSFRPDWKQGQCLYIPCDRISIVGHDAWANQHPNCIWTTSSDITLYLEVVYDLLNSSDYTGLRGS